MTQTTYLKNFAMRGAAATIVAGCLCGGAAYAAGAIPGADGVIHGCYRTADGRLRVIDPARAACRRDEASIQWNERGPRGVPGPPGPAQDLAPLRTAVAGQQTQIAGLQTQVASLQAQVAGVRTQIAAPQPTATQTQAPTATTTPAASLQSIAIAPAVPTLLGPTTQLTATGQYGDGTAKDLTASVTWRLTGGSGATLNASGVFTCPGGGIGGFFTVAAALGGVTGNAQEDCPAG